MSLWGVRVVMGSSLESLGTSFWDPLGVIFEALGSFGDFLLSWAVFSALWLRDPPGFNYGRSVLEE